MSKKPSASRSTARRHIRVWDLPVRLSHWVLLALMIALFVTGEILDDAMEFHTIAGLGVLALVLFRLAWGFVGSTYARFSQFLRGPRDVIGYTKSLLEPRPHFSPGHNPLGGWAVVALLTLIATQAAVGLFANNDIDFEGPLYALVSKDTSDFLTGLHEDLFHALLVLVALHVGALVWHKVFKGENLVPAMITGTKELPKGERAQDTMGGSPLLALALFTVCGGVVYWIAG